MKRSIYYVNKPAEVKIDHPLTVLSENYVLYASSIGVQYVYQDRIDIILFKSALSSFLAEFPALSGVANFKDGQIDPSPKGVPILIVENYPGRAADHGLIGKIQRNQQDFVNEPDRTDVESGKANLFAVQLTYFQNGGCILGLTVNHALGDATGHHLIAHRLSDHFEAVAKGEPVQGKPLIPILSDIFGFGTNRNKRDTLSDLKKYNLSKPLKVKGPVGFLFKKLITGALNKARNSERDLFYFCEAELTTLKETVKRESGLDWVSTNIAMGAHLSSVLSPLFLGEKPSKNVQLSNLFNMRNRYFYPEDERQQNYCGNAMYIHVERVQFENGIQNAGRGAIACALKNGFEDVTAEKVKREMDLVIDCLTHGYTYPNLNVTQPLIGINNQSKIEAYGVDFGAGELMRVIPQDVGDNILLFPGNNGGMEVYLRHSLKPKMTQFLREEKWQKRLKDF